MSKRPGEAGSWKERCVKAEAELKRALQDLERTTQDAAKVRKDLDRYRRAYAATNSSLEAITAEGKDEVLKRAYDIFSALTKLREAGIKIRLKLFDRLQSSFGDSFPAADGNLRAMVEQDNFEEFKGIYESDGTPTRPNEAWHYFEFFKMFFRMHKIEFHPGLSEINVLTIEQFLFAINSVPALHNSGLQRRH